MNTYLRYSRVTMKPAVRGIKDQSEEEIWGRDKESEDV
jgi:hypothetical protein